MIRTRIFALVLLALLVTLGRAMPARALASAEAFYPCCAGHHVHSEVSPNQRGDTSPRPVAEAQCSRCQGTGACSVCHGSGKNSSGDACSTCNGSGKCFFCNGTGGNS